MQDMIKRNVDLPGILWVVLLVGATYYAENYLPDPRVAEAAMVLSFAIAKAMRIDTGTVNDLLEITRSVLTFLPPQTRNVRPVATPAGEIMMQEVAAVDSRELAQYEPKIWLRYLLG